MTRKRKHAGVLPITGPSQCWRSMDIKLLCCKCGGRTAPMHSPTRRAGIWCASCCPCCNPTVASPVPAHAASGDGVIAPALFEGNDASTKG